MSDAEKMVPHALQPALSLLLLDAILLSLLGTGVV
jgi:hypothetical protein